MNDSIGLTLVLSVPDDQNRFKCVVVLDEKWIGPYRILVTDHGEMIINDPMIDFKMNCYVFQSMYDDKKIILSPELIRYCWEIK